MVSVGEEMGGGRAGEEDLYFGILSIEWRDMILIDGNVWFVRDRVMNYEVFFSPIDARRPHGPIMEY